MKLTSKFGGQCCYLYRGINEYGNLVDVFLSEHQNTVAAKAFFQKAFDLLQTIPDKDELNRVVTVLRLTHNWVRSHPSLERGITPAMAIGFIDRPVSLLDMFS